MPSAIIIRIRGQNPSLATVTMVMLSDWSDEIPTQSTLLKKLPTTTTSVSARLGEAVAEIEDRAGADSGPTAGCGTRCACQTAISPTSPATPTPS